MNNKSFTLILLSLILFSLPFDKMIIEWVVASRIDFLNPLFIWLGFLGTSYIVLFFMTSLFLWQENKRKWIVTLWFGMIATFILVIFLKFIFMINRPHLVLDIIPLQQAFSPSFPSLHAAIVFSAIPLLRKNFPKFTWFWIVFAILVSFSRLYVGIHYLSDVLAGALIGLLIGIYCVREKKFIDKSWKQFKVWFKK